MIAARLSDVRSNGEATRVTYGLLNLTHRDSSENPTPLEPGKRYLVRVRLNEVAQSFPEGHRLRLSLSTSYWPLAWPSPEPVCLTLHTANSRFLLPVRPPRPDDDAALPAFGEPVGAPTSSRTILEQPKNTWRVTRDLGTDESELHVVDGRGTRRMEDIGLTIRTWGEEWYRSRDNEVGSVQGETLWQRGLEREDWGVRTVCHTTMSSDEDAFHIRAELDAYEKDDRGEKRVFSRSWISSIPRDLV
jgi:hypothetical protein